MSHNTETSNPHTRNWFKKKDLQQYKDNINKLDNSTPNSIFENENDIADEAVIIRKNEEKKVNFNVDSIRRHIQLISERKKSEETTEEDASRRVDVPTETTHEEESSDEEEESGEDESSEESSSEEEEFLRPVFISKNDRATILSEEERLRIEQEKAEKLRREKEEKELNSKAMVAKILVKRELRAEKAKEEAENPTDEEDIPDDDDTINPEEEFELWKEREIQRLRDAYRATKQRKKEQEMLERRRKMTDEEIMEENRRLGLKQGSDKGDWAFLQKYYHRGAFFQEQDESGKSTQEIFNREILPTNTEKMDKTILPKVMQRRDFGKKGQTKYTHLVDQDTTDFSYGPGNKESWGHDRAMQYQQDKYSGLNRSDSTKRRRTGAER